MKSELRKKGFTLIELLVVIAIIGILSSVVMASLSTARLKARDARRMSDLNQIRLTMEFYYDDNGYYPRETDGANGIVGEGSGLDTMLASYFSSSLPHDPRGPGDADYIYYYDGRQSCSGGVISPIAVIFAKNMEDMSGNGDDYCVSWGGEGGAGGANTYHVVLGPSNDP